MATAKDKRAAARAALATLDLAAAPSSHQEASPKTGPGLLLRGVAINAEIEEENRQLKAQAAQWDGDAHARLIDAALIDESKWANRHVDGFASPEFAALKAEIASSGGNVQPIKVRAKTGGRYEIVFGHRRARACKELGLPVLAVIAEVMSEMSLFIEMDRENRQRADLSPWEQGVMYKRALDAGLFPSQGRLAEAVGVDLSNAGKCLALARLPVEIINAFASPLEIQLRWGGKLAKAFAEDPKGMLARAEKLAKEAPRRKAPAIFSTLIGSAGEEGGSEPPHFEITANGRSIGRLTMKKGSAVIDFEPGLVGPSDASALAELVKNWLASRV